MTRKVMGLFLLDGKGNFGQSFIVSLKNYSGDLPSLGAMEDGVSGELPPAPDLPVLYEAWQIAYRNYLDIRVRNPNDTFAPKKRPVTTNVSGDHQEWENQKQQAYQVCTQAEKELLTRFHEWLNSPGFGKVKSELEKYLFQSKDKANRILIESNDKDFQKMPWQKWDLLTPFSLSEVGLSSPNFKKRYVPIKPKERARVLVILGQDANIKKKIQQLATANTEIKFVTTLAELDDPLWNEAWDIIVFNGHSGTSEKGTEGKFQLSQDQWLSISDIRNHLDKAIDQGLKLVIFNSCDGLGLAHQLGEGQQLYLPQIMVMRDLLPMPLAPTFLQYFFEEFIKGVSLYSALRATRNRLEFPTIKDEFPCASWLPVICQNPAESPLRFQDLRGRKISPYPPTNERENLLKSLLSQLDQAHKAGNFERVIELGEQILKIDIQNQIALTKISLAYKQRILKFYHQGKYDEVIKNCDRAIILKPDFADFYYQRARAYHQKNKWQEVIENCNQAIKLKQEADYYWQRGRAYFKQSNYDQAIKDAQTAISINRQKADYHYLLGLSYYKKGLPIMLKAKNKIFDIDDQEKSNQAIQLYNQAINSLNEAIKINPDKVANYYWIRGLCYLDLCSLDIAEFDRAINDFDEANKLEPKPKNNDYNYLLGLSYFYKKDYDSAILHFLQASFLNKSTPSDYYYYLSYSYYNRDYSAERNYTQLYDLPPKSDDVMALQAIKKAIAIAIEFKLEYAVLQGKIEERIKKRRLGGY